MALLTVEQRERRLKFLGYGEYNEANIKKFQKKAFPTMPTQWDGKWGINTDRAARHFYNVKKYTKNFEPEEFKCECGGRYCTGYPSYMKKVELQNLQKIRDHYGRPMVVTCGLRCRGYNNSLAGSIPNSKHLTGYACDFYMRGVTDTLANRKQSIKWIKKLPNHNYTYGNGINSYGYRIAAGYMGNAMHTDTNKPAVSKVAATAKTPKELKKLSNREKINAFAKSVAHPYGTPRRKTSYKTGHPTMAFKRAYNKYCPEHTRWGPGPREGASCDSDVCLVVRGSGVDKHFPRGLSPSYLAKSKKFYRVKKSNAKPGDIIIKWNPKKQNGHICIICGKMIAEASYKDFYFKINNVKKARLNAPYTKVYRAK